LAAPDPPAEEPGPFRPEERLSDPLPARLVTAAVVVADPLEQVVFRHDVVLVCHRSGLPADVLAQDPEPTDASEVHEAAARRRGHDRLGGAETIVTTMTS